MIQISGEMEILKIDRDTVKLRYYIDDTNPDYIDMVIGREEWTEKYGEPTRCMVTVHFPDSNDHD